MVEQFEFNMPTRVLFGPGSLQRLHESGISGTRALVVISGGGSMRRHGQLDALLAELDQAGIAHVLFEGIRPNPTDTSVDEAAAMARENGCDLVVALGGGSTMDAAKIIAIMATNEGTCWEYGPESTGGGRKPSEPALPLVCVTTSAGTGSEVDMWSVITNDRTQMKTGFHGVFPQVSVVDPNLMLSVPANFTAYQGMDAFFHAAESMINANEHVMGEMFALKAIELIARYLPRAVADGSDVEARSNMAIANTLAGYYMMCTMEHTIEHAMGSAHPELPHGAGLIMISHEYFDFFAQRGAADEQLAKAARAMGVEGATSGRDFVAALDALIEAVGCADLRMSDYGIVDEELPGMVELTHTVHGGGRLEPIALTDDDILGMLERSYR